MQPGNLPKRWPSALTGKLRCHELPLCSQRNGQTGLSTSRRLTIQIPLSRSATCVAESSMSQTAVEAVMLTAVADHIGGSRCARGMRHCSLNVTVMVCMTCRVPRPRPGRERPPLTCPSGAAVSGPELSARCLREEDPPCCRRWRRARDALRARALRRRHGSGAGQAGGRCVISRAGELYIIAAIDEAAAGRGPGVRPGVSPLAGPRCGPSRRRHARARTGDAGRGAP